MRARPAELSFSRVELDVEAGGVVSVDWAAPPVRGGCAPVLIVLHGLLGGSAEPCVAARAPPLRQLGYF